MRPRFVPFALVRIFLAWLLLGGTGWSAGKGAIIYKDQAWLADEFADAIEYDQLEGFTNVYNLTTPENKNVSILAGKIVKNIHYLDRDDLTELMEPRDLARVSSAMSELSAAARQYPKSSKLLEPRIRKLQEIVDRFHKGEVIMGGAWFPSKEAAIKLKTEREAAIAAAEAEDVRQAEALRVAKEKRATDERARLLAQRQFLEKEALRKEEEAKAAEERRRLLEESQAVDARRKEEEQRMAKEKQAVDERHIEYASRKMREADRFTEEFNRPVSIESTNTVSLKKLAEGNVAQKAEDRAVTAAQTIVRKQLKTPQTARFQETRVLQEADPWYQIFIAVDAQNALGVFTRGTYVCTLKLGAGDEFSYDPSFGVKKVDEDAIKSEGVLGEIRAACGWRSNSGR
jgi:hypothetical protein